MKKGDLSEVVLLCVKNQEGLLFSARACDFVSMQWPRGVSLAWAKDSCG